MSIAGEGCEILVPFSERKTLQEIERSLTTTYKKNVWGKFIKAINDYQLIQEGDKIAVAISGGKDSLILAKLFQELKKHKKVDFEVEFIAMDPGYHKEIRKLLEENCAYLDIPVKIYESGIFNVIDKIAKDYPCYMCARMRRGSLYEFAQNLGCNKLALGHHFNDVIETVMLNVIYGGTFKSMLPKLKAQNFENMEIIRPLYLVEEDNIKNWIQNSGIWPMNCACMVAAKKIGNKRYEVREMIKNLKAQNKDVDKCIFRSQENIQMDSVVGWRDKNGEKHTYLEFYDDEDMIFDTDEL
ncbi:MAG: tRNA 2-thiocytidine biosynthesis protein TtcA [Clostridia bacterium]|jgi:tRNA(Ile)-lysidine synthase TilS/MesJ|uniref:tRNA 2-thiocytidine biosynthesis protein TtcA n=1 Tax=Proteiniclasticum aestuarii TaxID=2817862 RepID=A0A939HAS9_9CLOT|nr:ATP-binding protein [Proteiniclasticum aestuarii]MBO1264895.1 tRNA 2-thiocytidine biosynthesis protein TtcA [Proteiniclasticum aestuarii]NCC79849.1 tRNA 2-thiocytidine biosynthesis protein TtcA [Clostridia bacterium]